MKNTRVAPNDQLVADVLRARASATDPLLLDDILREVDSTEQVRPRLAWPRGTMPLPGPALLLLLILTLIGAAAIGSILIRPPNPDHIVPRVMPTDLRYVWLGSGEHVSGLGDGTATASFEFTADGAILRFGDRLRSSARTTDPGTMEVVLLEDDGDCVAGAIGDYRWELSPDRDQLTILPKMDECVMRKEALVGTWTRSDCPEYPDNFCLGMLNGGPHESVFFDPFALPSDWSLRRGAMTYTVPPGWANTADYPAIYVLVQSADDVVQAAGIFMSSDLAVVDDERPCSAAPSATVEPTRRAILEWLVGQDGVRVSEPMDATIGGLTGIMIDLQPEPQARDSCAGDGRRYVPLFTGATEGGLQWGVGLDQRMRVYLLDLPGGPPLVILVESLASDFEPFAAEAASILESVSFHPPN